MPTWSGPAYHRVWQAGPDELDDGKTHTVPRPFASGTVSYLSDLDLISLKWGLEERAQGDRSRILKVRVSTQRRATSRRVLTQSIIRPPLGILGYLQAHPGMRTSSN